jgi:hypothetical protein
MKQQKMMSEQNVVDALKFGKELPHLKEQFQLLVDEINNLEYKRNGLNCFIYSAKSNICSKGFIEILSIDIKPKNTKYGRYR